MGTYTIYTQGGGVITFQTGDDEYFNVGTGALDADLQSQGGLDEPLVSRAMTSVNDIQDGEGTLIGTLQATNFNKSVLELDKNNLLQAQNSYLKNQQKILKSSAVSAIKNTEQLLKSQDVNTSMLSALKESIEKSSSNNILMQGQILEAIQALTTATQNQKLQASFGDVSVNMNTEALNANTQKTAEAIQKIATANEKIALGQESQISTNVKIVENIEKKNEYLDFQKDGKSDLKDSNGTVIKPREIQAKKDAEQLIEQESTNTTTFDDISDYLADALGIVEDEVEAVVGSSDGFDLNFNPFRFLDDILVSDYIENKDNSVNKK